MRSITAKTRRVIEKVDKKFEDRLVRTEELVNGWYGGVVEKELAEVSD